MWELRTSSPVLGGLWRGQVERSGRKLSADMGLAVIVTLVAGAWCSLSSSRPAQAETDAIDGTRPAEHAHQGAEGGCLRSGGCGHLPSGLHGETSQGRAVATIRSTVVLAKHCSNWRIVHEHYSPLVAKR